MALYTFLAVILSSLLTANGKPVAKHTPTVTIDSGIIAGTTTSVSCTSSAITVHQFLGVPFAAPPVRFEPAHHPEPWDDVYDASQYKATCFQKFDYPEDARNRNMAWFNTPPPPNGESEDCLYLNVYAPAGATASSKSKAVLFWIFGGGFDFGSGALSQYDGSSFAANQDVIVVTFNYRTNVFGFPGAPEISKDQQNLGFVDEYFKPTFQCSPETDTGLDFLISASLSTGFSATSTPLGEILKESPSLAKVLAREVLMLSSLHLRSLSHFLQLSWSPARPLSFLLPRLLRPSHGRNCSKQPTAQLKRASNAFVLFQPFYSKK